MGRILIAGAVTCGVFGAVVLGDYLATGRFEISKHPTLQLRQAGVTLIFLLPIALFGWDRVLRGLARVPLFAAVAPISYGLYALHFPVIIWAQNLPLPTLGQAALAILVALLVAWVAERAWQPLIVRILTRLQRLDAPEKRIIST